MGSGSALALGEHGKGSVSLSMCSETFLEPRDQDVSYLPTSGPGTVRAVQQNSAGSGGLSPEGLSPRLTHCFPGWSSYSNYLGPETSAGLPWPGLSHGGLTGRGPPSRRGGI